MYCPFSLKGKTILVTGASSGIGKATAIECSKMGATVVGVGRSEQRLEETISNLHGDGHSYFVFDLTDENINDIIDPLPFLNGLVHCAGISQIRPVKYLDLKSLKGIMNNNFMGPINLNNLLLRTNKIKKNGSIVFISSISGNLSTQIGESGYASSKAALQGYVRGAAIDLANRNIRVNSILPGIVDTPLLNKSLEKFTEEEIQKMKDKYPLHRFGKPEEVGLCAVYLLSDASSFITGSSIVIDGGFSLS